MFCNSNHNKYWTLFQRKNKKTQEETEELLCNRNPNRNWTFLLWAKRKHKQKFKKYFAVEIITNIEQKLKIKSGNNKSWIKQWRVNFVGQLNNDNNKDPEYLFNLFIVVNQQR